MKNIDISSARHPSENSRFALALIICVPIALLGLVLTLLSYGIVILYILFLTFLVWFSLSIAKAHLIANSARVSEKNFPDVYKNYLTTKQLLNYQKEIPIYIIEEGSVNAILSKFFGTKFIILHSELVRSMRGEENAQMKWIIGRFIGAIQMKHLRLTILKLIIDSIEKIKVFNLFILPYERATQYSGDNAGLLVCGDIEQAFQAFNKMMVGNDLSSDLKLEEILDQCMETQRSFFAFLARIASTHPHTVQRYANLLAFSKAYDLRSFEKFIEKYSQSTAVNIGSTLPTHYPMQGTK